MVEWKKLGDICEIIRGNGVQKTDFVESGVGCIHYGQIYTHYGPFTYTTNKYVSKEVFEKARKASKGDIIMTDTSENVEDICKSVAYLGEEDIAVSNHALILKHKQNPKFLTYSTLTNSFLNQKRKYVVGAKVSGIKPEHLAQIKIYLPSLSEQNRIVGILDTFSASIDNLKEQIAQRRKQYEYYRDQLLDLEGKPGVEMKALNDCCTLITKQTGFDYSKTIKPSLTTNQNEDSIPFIQNKDFEGTRVNLNTDFYIPISVAKKFPKILLNEKILLISISGKIGNVGLYEIGNISFVGGAICVCRLRKNISGKYILYYLQSNKGQGSLFHSVKAASHSNITVESIRLTTIPFPAMVEQQRIVSILDTFEASIQNLEAQLKQREKQYEYYRNKLLTFE